MHVQMAIANSLGRNQDRSFRSIILLGRARLPAAVSLIQQQVGSLIPTHSACALPLSLTMHVQMANPVGRNQDRSFRSIIVPLIQQQAGSLSPTFHAHSHSHLPCMHVQMAIANPLGLAVGSVLSPSVVPDSDPKKIDHLLFIHLALAASTVLVILPISSRPPTPPSNTAPVPGANAKFSRNLSSLSQNLPYIALCNIFALAVGAFTALLTVLEQAMEPSGYSTDDAGLVSAVLIVCGIIGAGATPISVCFLAFFGQLFLQHRRVYGAADCAGAGDGAVWLFHA